MEKVKELIQEIRTNLSQTSSSQKDEVKVMRAMLNDKEYQVEVYGKEGLKETYCPAQDVRQMMASVMSSTTKVPVQEAESLMDSYEFKKNDASTMINVSKEFTNTFLQTGRKLPLGGREMSNVSLSLKEVEATTRTYPKKVGVNTDGSGRYEKAETNVNAHQSVKVHAPCPSWVK